LAPENCEPFEPDPFSLPKPAKSSRPRLEKAFSHLVDYAYLVRIFSCINGALLVYLLSTHQHSPQSWDLVAAAAAFCAIGCAFSLNDAIDLAEDQKNSPSRPVASGRITKREAFVAYGVLALSTIILALILRSTIALGIAIAMIVFASAYSVAIKPLWPIKTVTTALVISLLPVLAWSHAPHVLRARHVLLTVIFFLWSWQKEVLADVRDLEGDINSGLMTLPRWLRKRRTMGLIIFTNATLWSAAFIAFSNYSLRWFFVFAFGTILHTTWLMLCIVPTSPERARFYLRFQIGISAIGLIVIALR
jgi:4-hydroxybenzoate polyprenyltransferase